MSTEVVNQRDLQAERAIDREEQLDQKIDKVINETGGFGLF